jgi:serine/threonine-protein kinase
VVAVAATAGYLVAGRNSQRSTTSQPPTTSTTTAPTTPAPPPPVAEASLEGLLLSPNQINTAMGATGMRVTYTDTAMIDTSGNVPDQACSHMMNPIGAAVYAGSGWNAVRGQAVAESESNSPHFVGQNVVLFPSAQQADAFFTASAQQWPDCANRQFTINYPGAAPWAQSVGSVSNMNGALSATRTNSGERCQRALTVANNVAVDVIACGAPGSDAAVNIAQQIAAKVPAT